MDHYTFDSRYNGEEGRNDRGIVLSTVVDGRWIGIIGGQ